MTKYIAVSKLTGKCFKLKVSQTSVGKKKQYIQSCSLSQFDPNEVHYFDGWFVKSRFVYSMFGDHGPNQIEFREIHFNVA